MVQGVAAVGVTAAAVVLAAGASVRMGAVNKLLVPMPGGTVVGQAVASAVASAAGSVVVVTGHEAAAVRAAVEAASVTVVHNADYASGMASSLRAGVAAVAGDAAVEAVVVCLGDMPLVSAATLDALIAAGDAAAVCVPVCGGRRGNPVLWGRAFFPELLNLSGDRGARELLQKYTDSVHEVAVADEGIFFDVDTPAAVAALKKITATR